MTNYRDLAKTFITHRELFGFQHEREEIINFIRLMPAKKCLCMISQLNALPNNLYEIPQIREGFLSFLESRARSRGKDYAIDYFKAKMEGKVLYSKQGLMATSKWILAYGDFENEEDVHSVKVIISVIYLCMMVSDNIGAFNKENLAYDLVRNAQFNHEGDWAAELIRTLYIFTEIACNKNLYSEDEYIDFNADFKNYYGYSIWQYSSIVFGLYTIFSNNTGKINFNCFVQLNDKFVKTGLNDIANRITSQMTMTLDEAKSWAFQTLNEDWDYTLFWERPLLTLDGISVIPIFYRTLYANFFVSLKIKIEKCYAHDDEAKRKFLSFIGKPFEQYICHLLQYSIKESSAIKLTPEFNYSNKKSPDALLNFGKRKLLAFEAKAMYMRKNSIFFSDIQPVKEEINRLIVNPLSQLHDRLDELIKPNTWIDLTKIKEIYLITVSIGGIPSNPLIRQEINTRVESKITLTLIKGFYYLNIEEFELLCSLIEKPPKGRSIFNILDSIMISDMNFYNYVIINYKNNKRSRFIIDKQQEIFDELRATFDFIE